ncbi:anaerobic C4-dicarboxylate transporter family protein [Mesohalobacter halotolerans]|uniref:Anaerobic C4-dicarboxylate transporter n=1 Tax=Mesohalobacter halotolerans TaxID=1883405 RepID=A0A4U5TSJ2_9FLAO|nr:anaerobic C4-dicarboxylate transporter family protein [Mesohalobacter halotolerans]TKS57106.1 anaerobic C4-dicarboxylate transporter [Mesohalobacter halotolerans]
MLELQLLIFLACIVLGSRIGGIGMGAISGLGLLIFVFILGLPEGSPPIIVLGMILAVITALSAMEASNGIDFLVGIAEKIMKRKPQSITFIAPVVTYVLIFASGTQHVIYALLPVIAEISRNSDIRPERPIAMSVIAAQHGLIASPISAATVAMVGLFSFSGATLIDILVIIVPSTFIAIIIGCISVLKKGKELDKDPIYAEKISKRIIAVSQQSNSFELENKKNAVGSTLVFFVAIAIVVLLGLVPSLRPTYSWVLNGETVQGQISMGKAIMVIMLAAAAFIMLFFEANPKKCVSGNIMSSGIIALISILGISWLGSSFFEGNRTAIVEGISTLIAGYEWVFGIGLFMLSILLFSQAATVITLVPVGIALEIPTPLLIALYPAVNGYFFLPTYGTLIAGVNFDQTGTTKIGKYLVNHSFMLPGLVTTISAVLIALILTTLI